MIVNNKVWNTRHAIMLDRGANHCVVAFNSTEPNFLGSTGDLNLHGFTPHNNLFESNMGQYLKWDGRSDANAGQFQGLFNTGYRNLLTRYAGNKVLLENPGTGSNQGHVQPTLVGNVATAVTVPSGTDRFVGANRINGTVVDGDAPSGSTFPDSLYVTAKPSFLGTKPWPVFGPSATAPFGIDNTLPSFDRAKVNSPRPSPCLYGSQTGTKGPYYTIRNRSYNFYLAATAAGGNVVLSTTAGNDAQWKLIDDNNDGYYALTNRSFGTSLQANGATAIVTTSSGAISDHVRHWTLQDGNNDGFFGIVSRSFTPQHLKGNGSGNAVTMDGEPYANDEHWVVCPV